MWTVLIYTFILNKNDVLPELIKLVRGKIKKINLYYLVFFTFGI